ncbi:hypothetical protein BGZ68_004847 [Mortierella alpina]|nr:hypothetical protein BGZ68_004847 [Mortierella alpina]
MSKLTLMELHNAKLVECHALPKKSYEASPILQIVMTATTIIERENKRVMEGTVTQMAQKIHQVRDALERQTRVLEETHQKLAQLSNRLSQMEYQNRVKELERRRAREREEQRLEDERWIRAWDDLYMSGEHSSHGQSSAAKSAGPRLEEMEDVRIGLGCLDISPATDANQMEDIRAALCWKESSKAMDMKGKGLVDRGQGPCL